MRHQLFHRRRAARAVEIRIAPIPSHHVSELALKRLAILLRLHRLRRIVRAPPIPVPGPNRRKIRLQQELWRITHLHPLRRPVHRIEKMQPLLPNRKHVVLRHQPPQLVNPTDVTPEHRERGQTRLGPGQFWVLHARHRPDARRFGRAQRPTLVLKLEQRVVDEKRTAPQHERARQERQHPGNEVYRVFSRARRPSFEMFHRDARGFLRRRRCRRRARGRRFSSNNTLSPIRHGARRRRFCLPRRRTARFLDDARHSRNERRALFIRRALRAHAFSRARRAGPHAGWLVLRRVLVLKC